MCVGMVWEKEGATSTINLSWQIWDDVFILLASFAFHWGEQTKIFQISLGEAAKG